MKQSVTGGEVAVEVVTDSRRSVREYRHQGETYVAGELGCEYLVRLINNTHGRVLAVLTVDGRSVMDGQPGSKDSGGYVLNAGQEVVIPGWRLNDAEVARFKFGTVGSSYDVKAGGTGRNVGVIGCCFWAENAPLPVVRTRSASDGYKSAPMGFDDEEACVKTISARGSVQGLGTEFGRQDAHSVTRVNFVRSAELATLAIRYNDLANLIEAGVVSQSASPDPFPNDKVGCKPPSDWRG